MPGSVFYGGLFKVSYVSLRSEICFAIQWSIDAWKINKRSSQYI